MAIVTGFAVDKGVDGSYEIAVEIMNPVIKGREAELTPVVMWMEGESIFDAIRNLVIRVGKKLYWSHAKVVIISEEIAREGVLPVLDWVYRDPETRSDIRVLIARGSKAREILLSKAEIGVSVSFQLQNTFMAETVVNQFMEMELYLLQKRVSQEGITSMAATVNLIEQEEKMIPQVYGTAVFYAGKMVGWLNGEESRIVSWLSGTAQRGLIIQKKKEDGGSVIFELKKSSVQYKAVYTDELFFEVHVKANSQIAELNRTNPDYSNQKVLERLEFELEQYLEDRMDYVIQKIQKEFQSDILGLGSKTKNQLPRVWKQIGDNWSEVYPTVTVRVKVDMEVVGTSLMSNPIYMED